MATTLQAKVRAESRRLGFDLCEFTAITEAPHADFFDAWIDAGRAGEMAYLERNRDKRRFPARLAEAQASPFQTLIVLGVDYHQFDLPPKRCAMTPAAASSPPTPGATTITRSSARGSTSWTPSSARRPDAPAWANAWSTPARCSNGTGPPWPG